MRIATILEPHGAGRAVAEAATKRGHEIVLLDSGVTSPHPDVGYFRTCTNEKWKARMLAGIAGMQAIGVPTLPSFENAKLYDDKAAQMAPLGPWLPRTSFITSDTEAAELAPHMSYPFVSKSREGAQSRNVRLIETPSQAAKEIQSAFGPSGIQLSIGSQRGYLLWQEFVEGNPHDIRVIRCGQHLFGLKRYNREHVPFASGSGKREPITTLDDPNTRLAFASAVDITEHVGTRWACFDFVFRAGRALCLEISFSWVEKAYDDCPCFDCDSLAPNGLTAASWAEFAVDELERLASRLEPALHAPLVA